MRPRPSVAGVLGSFCLALGVSLGSGAPTDARHDGVRAARAALSCVCVGVLAAMIAREASRLLRLPRTALKTRETEHA